MRMRWGEEAVTILTLTYDSTWRNSPSDPWVALTPMSESDVQLSLRWWGQSAYTLRAGDRTVLIDPFDMRTVPEGMSIRFDYPQIPDQAADLLLITHEHFDHNGAAVATGEPHTVRSRAGRFETPLGDVVGIASEHDPEAGTRRGPN